MSYRQWLPLKAALEAARSGCRRLLIDELRPRRGRRRGGGAMMYTHGRRYGLSEAGVQGRSPLTNRSFLPVSCRQDVGTRWVS